MSDKKQSLMDLNDYLFERLEALTNPDLDEDGEKLEIELKKTAAIVSVSQTVINNANIMLKASQEARAYRVICDGQGNIIENKLLGVRVKREDDTR